MLNTGNPEIHLEILEEKLKDNPDEEKIKELKKESDDYCSDCLTKKGNFLVPGAGAWCKCGAEKAAETERAKEMHEQLKKDADFVDKTFYSDGGTEEYFGIPVYKSEGSK